MTFERKLSGVLYPEAAVFVMWSVLTVESGHWRQSACCWPIK